MSYRQSINEMLTMQDALNVMTNGEHWRSGKTALGKVIDWRRCVFMEAAELIDSYPWKHWKAVDAQTDIENARVELVDIWHFLLSLSLEYFEEDKAAEILSQSRQASDRGFDNLTVIEQVRVHEDMMATALECCEVSEEYLSRLASRFFNSCEVAGLSFDDLYQVYMAKNVLNKFRQDNGYKEGSYIKEWKGKEDNVVMFEIIAMMPTFSGDQLYKELKQVYSQL